MKNQTTPAEVRSNDGLCTQLRTHGRSDELNALVGDKKRLQFDERTAIEAAQEACMKAAAEIERLGRDLDTALGMLAAWCVAVDENGAGWDDWDEHYKDAMYRPGPLREQLDAAIAEARKQHQ